MKREAVHIGLSIQLVSQFLDVPPGTRATVDTVSTMWDGTWCFTVRWQGLKPQPGRRHRSDHSLNLWESDLDKFEIVTETDDGLSVTEKPPTLPSTGPPREQLTLPFGDL